MKKVKNFVVIAMIGFCLALTTPITFSSLPVDSTITVAAKAKNNKIITKKEYKKLKTGITYKKACTIIGGKGELISNTDLGIGKKYITKMYTWYGKDGISNACLLFQGGKLFSKSQFMLK